MTDTDPLRSLLAGAAPHVDADAALTVVRRRDRRRRRQHGVVAVAAVAVVVVGMGAGVLASRTTDSPRAHVTPAPDDAAEDVVTPPTFRLNQASSAMHPVQVEPRHDLREGQRVTVTGQGFPPGRLLNVTTCLPVALDGAGASACEPIEVTDVYARDDGTFEVEHRVQRLIAVGSAVPAVDCALVEGGCIVAVGDASDLVESGGVPVTFDLSAPLPEPPEVMVTPNADLREGDEIEVVVTGLDPRAYIRSANVCATVDERSGALDCEPVPRGERVPRAGADGSVSFSFVAHRRLQPLFAGGELAPDCGVLECSLVLVDERYRTVVPLGFDLNVPAPPSPAAEVSLPDPLTPGGRAEIDVEHFRPGQDVLVYLCPSEGRREQPPCLGDQIGSARAEEDGSAHLVVRVPGETAWYPNDPARPERLRVDCTRRLGRCDLVVTNFYDVIERVPLTFDE